MAWLSVVTNWRSKRHPPGRVRRQVPSGESPRARLSKDTHIEYLEEFTCPQQYQRLVIGADGLAMKCSNDEENREVIGDIKQESIYQVWHGKNMQAVRDMHLQHRGFMQSAVCRKCYLPRKTEDEAAQVGGRTFIVRNYVHRVQQIGK